MNLEDRHAIAGTAAPRLAELQNWLRVIFTDPRGVEAAWAERALRFDQDPAECLPFIAESESLDRFSRLNIYAEAYFLRIHDTLAEEAFSGVRQWVGAQGFRLLVTHFLKHNPSRYWNIEDLGADFARYLGNPALHVGAVKNLENLFPFLSELADFEWAVIDSFYSDKDQSLAPGAFENAGKGGACTFKFKNHVRLRSYRWAVAALCSDDTFDVQMGQDSCSPHGKAIEQRYAIPCFLLIFRDLQLSVQTISLCKQQYEILQKLMDGASLEDALEFENEAPAENSAPAAAPSAEDVQKWFQEWMQLGIFASMS